MEQSERGAWVFTHGDGGYSGAQHGGEGDQSDPGRECTAKEGILYASIGEMWNDVMHDELKS